MAPDHDNKASHTNIFASQCILKLCFGVGREAQEGGDICILRAVSHCCTAGTNTKFQSNYPPIKTINILIIRILFVHGNRLSAVELKCVRVLVIQSYLTLCDPVAYSLPGSSVHGILPEWVAISFPKGSSQPRD